MMSYNKEIESYGYSVLDKQVKIKKEKFTCIDGEGYVYITNLETLIRGSSPRKVCKVNPYSVQNMRLFSSNYKRILINPVYNSNTEKLEWYCLIHNKTYYQHWANVTSGQKCPDCSREIATRNKTKSQEQFISEITEIYGSKYDYSKVKYINNNEKVCIICKIHGEFWSYAGNLLAKHGCAKCHHDKMQEDRSLNYDEIINKIKKVHGDTYDLSLFDYSTYVNLYTKIPLICKKHGAFEIQLSNLAYGSKSGCQKCGDERNAERCRFTKDQAIENLYKKHGDKYEFSIKKYDNNMSKVRCICKIHGAFSMTYSSLASGSECRKCSHNDVGWTINKWLKLGRNSDSYDYYKVYFIRCWDDYECFYKIGRTFQKISQRFCGDKAMPYKWEVIHKIESHDGKKIFRLEHKFHKMHSLANLSYKPNMHFGGDSECFSDLLIKM